MAKKKEIIRQGSLNWIRINDIYFRKENIESLDVCSGLMRTSSGLLYSFNKAEMKVITTILNVEGK